MRIAEKLIQITNDIKLGYLNRYGITSEWDIDIQDLFFLNCDAEILNYLKEEDLEPHEEVFKTGISFGLYVLQEQIKRMYYDEYGDNMSYVEKEDMFEKTQECVYNYVMNGVTDAY